MCGENARFGGGCKNGLPYTDLAEPYYNRGMMFVRLQEWEKAKEDLTTARDKQENIIIEQFRKEYENVADFEQKHEIKLPEDIAAMLTPS